MVRRLRRQHKKLSHCKRMTKALREKGWWPELVNVLEDWKEDSELE